MAFLGCRKALKEAYLDRMARGRGDAAFYSEEGRHLFGKRRDRISTCRVEA